MARGGLGSAWSLKVAAVWTNLPVSHVTPSVSPGMWEEAAHPRSCHTVSALPFFFFFPPLSFFLLPPPPCSCNRLLCRGRLQKADLLPWASRVVGCIIINIIRFFKIFFFFLSKFKVTGLFVLVAKRSAAFDYIFMPLLTFNFPSPLRRAPGENMARKVAEVFPAALWFQKPLPAAAHAEDAVSSAW